MKVLILSLAGILTIALPSGVSPVSMGHGSTVSAAPQSATSSRVPAITGTVIAIFSHRAGAPMILRGKNGQLSAVKLSRQVPLTTADGRALTMHDIRVGDRLVSAAGKVRDVSQQTIHVRGIVSSAPLSSTDPIIVALTRSKSIVVDTGKNTRYDDFSKDSTHLSQLTDSDMVELRGVYDAALGEMTTTDRVSWLGPTRKSTTGRRP